MKYNLIILVLFVLFSCTREENEIISSDKILKLISNNTLLDQSQLNDFTNFDTEIEYENDNINLLRTSRNNFEYTFYIANNLVSECIVTTNNNSSIRYIFFYEFYNAINSHKINRIQVFEGETPYKSYTINFDGFREIITDDSDLSNEYAVIFDEFNRIKAFSGRNSTRVQFTYNQENLTSLKINNQYEINFEYDNKNNPFSLGRFKNLTDIFNYINIISENDAFFKEAYNTFSNKNNLTKIIINNYPDLEFKNYSFSYEYNNNNYPIKKVNNETGLTILYNYE